VQWGLGFQEKDLTAAVHCKLHRQNCPKFCIRSGMSA
jgi:hypothetical protein